MKRIAGLLIAAAAVGSFGLTTDTALAAKEKSAYSQKKAECNQEAKAKHFGIHWAKKNRWIKNCIAGQRT
jgi:hypothetical protein